MLIFYRCKLTPLLHRQHCLQLPRNYPNPRAEKKFTATSGSTRAFVPLHSLVASINTRCRWTRQLSSRWASIMVSQSGISAHKQFKLDRSHNRLTLHPPLVLPGPGAVRLQPLLYRQVNPSVAGCNRLLVHASTIYFCDRANVKLAAGHSSFGSSSFVTAPFGPIGPPIPAQQAQASNNPYSMLSPDTKSDDEEDPTFVWRGRGR